MVADVRVFNRFGRRARATLGLGGTFAVVAAATVHCSKGLDNTAPTGPELTATVDQALSPATGLTPLWSTDFDQLKITKNTPDSSHDWYAVTNFRPNGESEYYDISECQNYADTSGLTVDATNYVYCVVNDANATGLNPGVSATNALQIRGYWNAAAGQWKSGRIDSKRMHEFAPSSGVGIQVVARLKAPPKYNADNSKTGAWPAFWMLGRNINDAPVIGDGDTQCWPNDGAHEIDIFEWGTVWPGNYDQSSLHYRTGAVVCQSPSNNPSVNNGDQGDTGKVSSAYHVYTMEWETTKMRFFQDGVQEGADIDVSTANYGSSFILLNLALGGNLGGTMAATSSYPAAGLSYLVDYVQVSSYNPSNRGGGTSTTGSSTTGSSTTGSSTTGSSTTGSTGTTGTTGSTTGTTGGGLTALSRTGWVATGNPTLDPLTNAFDGNITTRWDTGANQAVGDTFSVNMGSKQTFSQVVLDANGSTTNFAQSLEVDVSSDGTTWTAVSPAPTITYVPQQTITFSSAITTQYIQFKLLAGGPHWWSIYEMNAYSGGGGTTGSTTGGSTGSTTGGTTGSTTGSTGTTGTTAGPGNCGNQQTALSRTGWVLTASSTDPASPLSQAIDGNVNTRWSNGKGQAPGQWIQIDLGANPGAYDDITLDSSGQGNDWGRSISIATSPDGTTWTDLTVTGTPQAGVSALTYNCSTNRYIKITQQSTTPSNWWSIGEINVLR
jgi:hypothetical protein